MVILLVISAIALTVLVFFAFLSLQTKTGILILNPILLSIVVIIGLLKYLDWDYATYHEGSRYIEWMLKPAVVAMGVPLYQSLNAIKKQLIPILISQIAGCVIGLFTVVLVARELGASNDIILSLTPKSVSSAIAIGISEKIGGIPSLSAAVAISVGLLGALFAYPIMRLIGIKNPISQSLGMGLASHGIGTARSLEISPRFGAYSTLALILNGVLTSFLAPIVVHFFL